MMDKSGHWLLRWFFILTFLAATSASLPAWAGDPNQVGLVVVYGGDDVLTRCISFSDAEISGHEVLKKSGLEIETEMSGGLGAAICFIEKEGCRVSEGQPCFCKCQGPPCVYWSYWHLQGESWKYSNGGASNYFVRNGDVEGWVWGAGTPNEATSPPAIPFDQICVPPTPTPTPVPPTDTPIPTDTATPSPTKTPTATPPSTPSINLSLSVSQIGQGECAQLEWKVSQAQAVYLNGQGVTGEESRQVCPSPGAHTFELRVTGLNGEEYREQASLQVVEKPTATSTIPATAPLAEMSSVQAGQSPNANQAGASPETKEQPTAVSDFPEAAQAIALPTATPHHPEALPTPTMLAMAQPSENAPSPAAAQLSTSPPAESTVNPSQVSIAAPPPEKQSLGPLASKAVWFVILSSTAVGIVGGGGLTFVGFIILLAVVYRRFSRADTREDGDE